MSALPAVPTTEAPPSDEEEVVPPDEEIVEPEETAPAEEAPEGEAPDEAQELLDAIDALEDDDPRKLALKAKFAPLDADEQLANFETEKDRAERTSRVTGARQAAAAYAPDAAFPRILDAAYTQTAQWQQGLEALGKQILDGDYDPSKGMFDAGAAAGEIAALVASEIERALPTATGHVTAQIEHYLLSTIEASPIYKQFTTEDRQALKAAQRLQYADHRIAAINAVALEVAIRGGPKVKEQRTKAEQAAEAEKATARAKLLAAVGGRTPGMNGNGRFRDADKVLDDPNSTLPQLKEAWKRKFGTEYELRS